MAAFKTDSEALEQKDEDAVMLVRLWYRALVACALCVCVRCVKERRRAICGDQEASGLEAGFLQFLLVLSMGRCLQSKASLYLSHSRTHIYTLNTGVEKQGRPQGHTPTTSHPSVVVFVLKQVHHHYVLPAAARVNIS